MQPEKGQDPTVMAYFIVHADDFGISREASDCILEAHINGCIDRTSVLPNGEAFEYAVQLLKENPRLQYAVHLNLVEGKALSDREKIPDLVDNHGFFKNSFLSLWTLYLIHRKKRSDLLKQIEEELGRQIFRVRNALGCEEVTIDSHRYAHMLPFIWHVIIRLAKEWNIAGMRIPFEPFFLVKPIHRNVRNMLSGNLMKHMILNTLSKKAVKSIRPGTISHPDYFIGVLFGGCMSLDVVRAAAQRLMKGKLHSETVIEILFHPGHSTNEEGPFRKESGRYNKYYISENRGRELHALLSSEMKRYIREISSARHANKR
jgi:predicted glycoside hydrolase/deacetylase ChbG (UPF0249 family)